MFRKPLQVSVILLGIAAASLGRAEAAAPVKVKRTELAKIVREFPNLRGMFKVLRPGTKRYNCIAWSLGITKQWVWPGNTVRAFDRLNGRFGYRRINKLDYRRLQNVDKIVLYAKYQNGRLSVTHQARQMRDGSWSSKLGQLPLIRHTTPDSLDSASYGRPVAVYVRNHRNA